VTTDVVNHTLGFYSVECHMCDLIEEEVNIILFLAVGLLVIMILAIFLLAGGYLFRHLRRSSQKIGYTQYVSEDVHV
jgi:hypothetical protein